MSQVLICESDDLAIDGSGVLSCTDWLIDDYFSSELVEAMDYYLGFDTETFGIVLGAYVVSFLTALFAGKVARVMSRT